MQPIEVVWWGGQRGSWCQAIVEFLTEGMTHRMDISELQGDGAIVGGEGGPDEDARPRARDFTMQQSTFAGCC